MHSNSGFIPMAKLTRKEIREGLKQIPIETVLLGTVGARQKTLTAKQMEFARQLALGETKAGAYRKSRETKAKPETASRRGQELAKDSAIQAQVEAFKVALEAQRIATPAHLRALTIHELTKGALDPEMPPAQRVKCLELLGKITEVALFTERREVVKVTDSSQIRDQLLASIRSAIKAEAIDVIESSGDELLAELAEIKPEREGMAEGTGPDAPPPLGSPPKILSHATDYMHTNPHNGSAPLSEAHQPNVSGSAIPSGNWVEHE